MSNMGGLFLKLFLFNNLKNWNNIYYYLLSLIYSDNSSSLVSLSKDW